MPVPLGWKQLSEILGTIRWRDLTIGIGCLSAGAIFYDVYRLKPANSHSAYSLVIQYLLFKYMGVFGQISDWRFNRACKNGKLSQEKALKRILLHAKGTSYATEHNIKENMSVAEFIHTQPLTDYSQYLPYVERMVDGEENVMFKEKADFFGATSGTSSGKSKLYPKQKATCLAAMRRFFIQFYCKASSSTGISKLYKWLDVRFKAQVIDLRPGVQKGPMSAAMFTDMPFVTAPKVAYSLTSLHQAVYVQLVFGLAEKQVAMLSLGQPAHALTMFKTLERRWDDICLDIEIGQLHDGIQLDPGIKAELERAMIPNPDRASELRKEFRQGFKDIIPRVWPEAAAWMSLASGTFELQALLFKDLYAGDVPLFSSMHGSTEVLPHGFNLFFNSTKVTYVLCPQDVFFEFIPLEEVEKDVPITYQAHELIPGMQYESVATTLEGLYRYRTGDIIQVERFYYQMPVYMYMRRVGDMLNVFAEKTADYSICKAIQNAFSKWPELELHQYACTESTNVQHVLGEITGDMHYVMFLEEANGQRLTQQQCTEIDNELMDEAEAYRIYRQRERLLPLQVMQVLPGTFNKFRHLLLSLNSLATDLQVKALRVLKRDDHLKFFLENGVPPNLESNTL